ncbi:conjugative relaxase [Rhizobium sp. VS19-DR104.2]|uniref:MobF family relaxase n=1 Tax=Rhizobium/Agrobacterium group TaxID=227290 RepID=UPI001CC50B7A|nr:MULTISPECIES: MobF family relaxase [unclassified Rhizobium]MBZ5763346.1 conjugative relaxase [Rhizobium sp. VS19-DR96]MBZ5769241.1 conjugative relaxase [Rhizobium sp. VS19-DR129.2]MBZ5776764.1 conjugative relaxase [Rhizobium sp. VS19-DRK62.2]MBZ5786648.1 conjugative relaxase [Rhizobium sp. VS19-DR121]MBZ5805299.1 conjugative relaxase [Rhizobium sp. VS19-DR181]
MIDITVITRQSVGKVVSYYADGADDYYAKDGTAMQWQGEGAAALGLEGEVDRKRFGELLDGRIDEHTRTRRIPPTTEAARKERLAYDLTFSAPKGVSLQALVHGDHRIVEAHERAVAAAVREAESLAMARSTANKKTSVEHTGKLVVAKFRHETSRALDPDLHTHAVVLNLTQRADGQWRALTSDGIVKSLRHLGNVYKSELARELEKAGFTLRYERNGTFDLAHFTEHQIREFSARSQQIEAALAAQGLNRETATHAQKNQAALSTRQRKVEVDRAAIRQEWQKRAAELAIDFHSREWAGKGRDGVEERTQRLPPKEIEKPLEHYADKAVQFAIKSLTERNAIVKQSELEDVALKHGFGRVTTEDIRAALDRITRSGHLIRELPVYVSMNPGGKKKADGQPGPALTRQEWVATLQASGKSKAEAIRLVDMGVRSGRLAKQEPRFTTHIAQKRERDILQTEQRNRGVMESRIAPEVSRAFLADKSLNEEQRRAVQHIVESANRFIGVQGYAGTGKTHMTKAAAELLEANGFHVTTMAPYGSQKKALEEAGLDSRTVQAFLRAKDKKIDANSVVFVDEAGVIPARQMLEIMKTIEAHGARAVFLGDTTQTKAIEAGKPFDQLQKAGMDTAHLVEIRRQKDPQLLEAVKLAAEGQTEKSVAQIRQVLKVPDPDVRYSAMVQRYAELPKHERDRTLIITGTNESRKELNAGVRKALGLEGQGLGYQLLNRLDTTQAERQHSRYYKKGSVIVPERSYANGLRRGEHYTVLDTGPGNRLTVRDDAGQQIQFSPMRCPKLSVYSVEKTELAVGDQVKVTRNNADLDLANGDRFVVQRVDQDEIELEGQGGRRITFDATTPMFVALAYASTVHSSQGLTCDTVLINIETASRTTTKDVYYVGVSRARQEAIIYTDDAGKLASAVSRDSLKTAALEIKQLAAHAIDRQQKTKSGPHGPEVGLGG